MFYGDMLCYKIYNGLKTLKIKTRSSHFMAQSRALSHIFCLSLFWSPFIMDSKQLNTSENLYSTGDRVIYSILIPIQIHRCTLYHWLLTGSRKPVTFFVLSWTINVCQHAIQPIYLSLIIIIRHWEDPWLFLEKILTSNEITQGVCRRKLIITQSKLSTFKTNVGR